MTYTPIGCYGVISIINTLLGWDVMNEKEVSTRWDSNPNGVAVQDNDLIRAAYQMSLNTKRLFLLSISKINSMNFAKKDTCIGVQITVEEWSKLYGADNSWTSLKKATNELMNTQVTIRPLDKKRKKVLNILDSSEYFEGEAKCHLRFSWSTSNLLAGMLDEFTKIDLLSTAKFTSKNSVRLYELLSQMKTRHNDKFWLHLSIDEARVCLGFNLMEYPRFTDFRRCVLEPSIAEINTQSDLKITSVEYLKEKRKVVAVRFNFIANNQMPLL
jgi:plasmid replication initiation protein